MYSLCVSLVFMIIRVIWKRTRNPRMGFRVRFRYCSVFSFICLVFHFESQGIHPYLLYHGKQTVAACRAQMLFQAYSVDEV